MAYMAKDKIVRTGTDLNLSTLVDLQTDSTVLGTVADAAGAVAFDRLTKIDKVALVEATGTTAGGVLNWVNPEGADIIITRLVVRLTGVKAGQTVDFGTSASTAATSDNLIDGVSTATAGIFDNFKDAGTNGKAIQQIASGERITGTASAALTGGTFAGFAYIHYVLA